MRMAFFRGRLGRENVKGGEAEEFILLFILLLQSAALVPCQVTLGYCQASKATNGTITALVRSLRLYAIQVGILPA